MKNVFSHTPKLIGTEISGHRHTKATAKSGTETQHQKLNTAGSTNTCQSLRAQKTTDNGRINHIVCLL